MIMDILNRNKIESRRTKTKFKRQKKINLIIDEYDGESLDQSEARKLNGIINNEYKDVFKDAAILLIAQSMKRNGGQVIKLLIATGLVYLKKCQRKDSILL